MKNALKTNLHTGLHIPQYLLTSIWELIRKRGQGAVELYFSVLFISGAISLGRYGWSHLQRGKTVYKPVDKEEEKLAELQKELLEKLNFFIPSVMVTTKNIHDNDAENKQRESDIKYFQDMFCIISARKLLIDSQQNVDAPNRELINNLEAEFAEKFNKGDKIEIDSRVQDQFPAASLSEQYKISALISKKLDIDHTKIWQAKVDKAGSLSYYQHLAGKLHEKDTEQNMKKNWYPLLNCDLLFYSKASLYLSTYQTQEKESRNSCNQSYLGMKKELLSLLNKISKTEEALKARADKKEKEKDKLINKAKNSVVGTLDLIQNQGKPVGKGAAVLFNLMILVVSGAFVTAASGCLVNGARHFIVGMSK